MFCLRYCIRIPADPRIYRHMQDCFREYPEIYGSELADEEAAAAEGQAEGQPPVTAPVEDASAEAASVKSDSPAQAAKEATKVPLAEDVMTPKEAFDTTDANEKVEKKSDKKSDKKKEEP